MSDILRPTGQEDEEEYEGLFKSFQVEETPEPAPEKQRGGIAGILSAIKNRRKAHGKRKAPAKEKPESPSEDGEAPALPTTSPFLTESDMLEEPLDIDSAREALLSNFDEPEPEQAPEPKKKPRKQQAKKGKFTKVQMIVLSILGIFIIAIYAALAVIVLRTRPQQTDVTAISEEGIVVITPSGTEIAWAGSEEESTANPPAVIEEEGEEATEEASIEEEESPTAEPTPTPTPMASPSVATKLDLQVLRDPGNLELRIQRGEEYLRLGAYNDALQDFNYALTLDKKRPEIHLGLGKAYFYLRRWDEAQSSLGTAIAFEEEMEAAHFWLGTVHYYAGEYEKAAEEFDWAAEIAPTNARNELWLALASARLDNLEETRGAVERGLAQDDSLPLAYLAKAELLVMQDNIEEAQGDLIYAKSLDPHNFDVLNALARFYADHVPERITEAEYLVQQAQSWARWDIQKAQALHTLGRIYLAQDRKEDAKTVLGQAAELAMVDGKIGLPELVTDLDRTIAP